MDKTGFSSLDKERSGEETGTMESPSPFGELIKSKSVLLPTLASVIFVVSLFLVAAAGQNRLAESYERIRAAEYRALKLVEFTQAMAEAESAVRGYVITGDKAYLRPMETAQPQLEAALADLMQAYSGSHPRSDASESLGRLSETNLGLLNQIVARRAAGYEPAALLIRANVGERTMDQLREVVAQISAYESTQLQEAQRQVDTDTEQGGWLLALGTLLNVLLVVLAGILISRDLRRRSLLAVSLEVQRQSLERNIQERTEDLAALSTHLQNVSEQERAALARELHDELGSLLVAARMDLSWLERRLPSDDSSIKLRWQRIQDSLDAGVSLKRRVVEQLRPTLLDNMGLYAALRWQLQESCGRAGLRCTERYPDPELQVNDTASIAIFRMVQEAFTNILKHAKAKNVHLEVAVDATAHELLITVTDDGVGLRQITRPGASASHGLVSMRHRITALVGTLSIEPGQESGTVLTARLPLDKIRAVTGDLEAGNGEKKLEDLKSSLEGVNKPL